MRLTALAALALLVTGPAFAQKEWAPAPVPNVAPNSNVTPMDRAGRATGPDRGAPFSDLPTGSTAAGGQTSANQGDGLGTPSVSR